MIIQDPTWKPFDLLMQKHIYRVLFVTSNYDRFLIEEDGRIEQALYDEYTQLGLSTPPSLSFATTAKEALDLVREGDFGLVITMIDLDEQLDGLCHAIKGVKPDLPIIVLSPSASHRRNKQMHHLEDADYLFYWQGNPRIFLAMVKLVEDRMNLDHDTRVADVGVIILVEDSVRFYSSYLPLMYTCLIDNNNSTMLEALNDWGKHLRMRGRPKILLATTYDEAWELLCKYRLHVLGLISDISFEREGKRESDAGFQLAHAIRKVNQEIPILLQSTEAGLGPKAKAEGFSFLCKQSSTLLSDLYDYMNREYGFGPFLFRDPETGKEVAKAESTRELQELLPSIDSRLIVFHSKRNDFSRWLRAQGLFSLARKVHDIKLSSDPEATRDLITSTIRSYREARSRRTLTHFERTSFDDTTYFSRIGTGSLGGKGRSLAFIDQELSESGLMEKWKEKHLSIPPTVVLCSDLFREFVDDLASQIYGKEDKEIDALFLGKPLPLELENDLTRLLQVWRGPLAIRSSSLLEDSHYQPFAGVYDTCMISSRSDDLVRLKELEDAIRCVWASTFHQKAKTYLKATEHMQEEEEMAVLIQPVVGSWWGELYYPTASGVARSLDFWPIPGTKRSDGVAQIALGLGKSVVDGFPSLRFCPKHPKKEMPQKRQERFFALEDSPFTPLEGGNEHLVLKQLGEAEPLSLSGVVTIRRGEWESECVTENGLRTVTFRGMLRYESFPVAAIICDLLQLGERAMHTPVEVEFAIDLPSSRFTLLQIRPMVNGKEDEEVHIFPKERAHALLFADQVIGNGLFPGIHDIIAMDFSSFERMKMGEMALELEQWNKDMGGRPYVLATAGRIGSSDQSQGIPVSWSQIASCRVLVEIRLGGLDVEPSQGSHFFQNLTSLGCAALTANLDQWKPEKLGAETGRSRHFRHWHLTDALVVKVDGRKNQAIVALGTLEHPTSCHREAGPLSSKAVSSPDG